MNLKTASVAVLTHSPNYRWPHAGRARAPGPWRPRHPLPGLAARLLPDSVAGGFAHAFAASLGWLAASPLAVTVLVQLLPRRSPGPSR
jgi:hypothetical protein